MKNSFQVFTWVILASLVSPVISQAGSPTCVQYNGTVYCTDSTGVYGSLPDPFSDPVLFPPNPQSSPNLPYDEDPPQNPLAHHYTYNVGGTSDCPTVAKYCTKVEIPDRITMAVLIPPGPKIRGLSPDSVIPTLLKGVASFLGMGPLVEWNTSHRTDKVLAFAEIVSVIGSLGAKAAVGVSAVMIKNTGGMQHSNFLTVARMTEGVMHNCELGVCRGASLLNGIKLANRGVDDVRIVIVEGMRADGRWSRHAMAYGFDSRSGQGGLLTWDEFYPMAGYNIEQIKQIYGQRLGLRNVAEVFSGDMGEYVKRAIDTKRWIPDPAAVAHFLDIATPEEIRRGVVDYRNWTNFPK